MKNKKIYAALDGQELLLIRTALHEMMDKMEEEIIEIEYDPEEYKENIDYPSCVDVKEFNEMILEKLYVNYKVLSKLLIKLKRKEVK